MIERQKCPCLYPVKLYNCYYHCYFINFVIVLAIISIINSISPRGLGIPVTLNETLTSSPELTVIDFSEGLETNMAGFPPSIALGEITSTVAMLSTWP